MCKEDCMDCNCSPNFDDKTFVAADTSFNNRPWLQVVVTKTDFYEKGGLKISPFVQGKFKESVNLSNKQRLALIKFLGGIPLENTTPLMQLSEAIDCPQNREEKLTAPKPKTPVTDNKIKPNHYKLTIPVTHENKRILAEVECGDVLKAIEQPFYTSNAMKYLWRAGKKDGESYFDDIRKAKQCLEEELKDRQFE